VTSVRSHDGYEALVDHAFELFWMGAAGAAGAVAGTAFETLMQNALIGDDRHWLQALQQAGNHPSLNDVIGKVAASHEIDDARLRAYQRLRNDLAHRLGDGKSAERSDDEIRQLVRDFLGWLDGQSIDDNGVSVLTRTDPDPALTHEQLFDLAVMAGNAAATEAQTSPMRIGSDRFEPFGWAWVTFSGEDVEFESWLQTNTDAHPSDRGVQIHAPNTSLERNLAWAHAFCVELRSHGISAS